MRIPWRDGRHSPRYRSAPRPIGPDGPDSPGPPRVVRTVQSGSTDLGALKRAGTEGCLRRDGMERPYEREAALCIIARLRTFGQR